MIEKFRELIKNYIEVYWDIKDDESAITAEQREEWRAKLLELFSRESAIMDGEDGLARERQKAEHEIALNEIAENKKLRIAEKAEEYRLKHVELTKRAELQRAKIEQETQLELTRITEETLTQEVAMSKEFDIRRAAEEQILDIKADRIVPSRKTKKRWWQIRERVITNRAYDIAEEKANLEAEKYLSDREDEVVKMLAEQTGTAELEVAVRSVFDNYIDKNRGRKAKAARKTLQGIKEPLLAVFARRERALEKLIAKLASDGTAKENEPEQQPESAEACEHEELQQLTVFGNGQSGEEPSKEQQQKKPPRRRIRRKPELEQPSGVEEITTDKEGKENDR